MDYGEQFGKAGIRECIEEANMEVKLVGVLNLNYFHRANTDKAKMRTFYYAEPVDLEAADRPKDWVDRESQKAEWKTLDELKEF